MSNRFSALLLAGGIATSVIGLTTGAFAGPFERIGGFYHYEPPIRLYEPPIAIAPPPPVFDTPIVVASCVPPDRGYWDTEGNFQSDLRCD